MHRRITLKGNQPNEPLFLQIFLDGQEIGMVYPTMYWHDSENEAGIEPYLRGYSLTSPRSEGLLSLEEAIQELIIQKTRELRAFKDRLGDDVNNFPFLRTLFTQYPKVLDSFLIMLAMQKPTLKTEAIRILRMIRNSDSRTQIELKAAKEYVETLERQFRDELEFKDSQEAEIPF